MSGGSMIIKGILLLQVIFVTFEVTHGVKMKNQSFQKLVGGNTEFGLKLYNEIAKGNPEENVFFSPASISFALALTLLGARGDTSKELKETLHLANIPERKLPALYKNVTDVLLQTDDKYQLHIANRLYGDKSFKILQSFLKKSERFFGSKLNKVDFINNPTGAAKVINDWVSQQTNNKIKDLVPPGVLNRMTRLVLVNAIYFKGDWQTKFDKKKTGVQDFFINKDHVIKTELLFLPKIRLNYAKDAHLQSQVVELPYSGEHLSFYIILPDLQLTTLEEVESKLSAVQLKTLELNKTRVNVWLPKFKMEYNVQLVDYLKKLGLEKLFDPNEADLTGINEKGGLYVSKVLHKAFIEVNEEGSEAAGATAVVMTLKSAPVFRDPIVNVKADHPFLFYIKDNRTGTILFLGRFAKP